MPKVCLRLPARDPHHPPLTTAVDLHLTTTTKEIPMEQQLQPQQRRLRGEGSIYRNPRSQFLWIKYHFAGKAFRESSRTADPANAARFLRQRLAQIERGESFGPQIEKVRIEHLAEDLLRDYRINGHKSLADVEARWRLHLQPFFGPIRAIHLGSTLLAE